MKTPYCGMNKGFLSAPTTKTQGSGKRTATQDPTNETKVRAIKPNILNPFHGSKIHPGAATTPHTKTPNTLTIKDLRRSYRSGLNSAFNASMKDHLVTSEELAYGFKPNEFNTDEEFETAIANARRMNCYMLNLLRDQCDSGKLDLSWLDSGAINDILPSQKFISTHKSDLLNILFVLGILFHDATRCNHLYKASKEELSKIFRNYDTTKAKQIVLGAFMEAKRGFEESLNNDEKIWKEVQLELTLKCGPLSEKTGYSIA